MLDVHPPHAPTHTWKDFFLHIATIVIGLLIAVGLEQTVEYLHHRHLVAEARTQLDVETQINTAIFRSQTEDIERMAPLLKRNIAIFLYLRAHPGAPSSAWPGQFSWYFGKPEYQESSWNSARNSGVLTLMPRTEVQRWTSLYEHLHYMNQKEEEATASLWQAMSYGVRSEDPATMTAAEIDEGVRATTEALTTYAVIINAQTNLHSTFPRFSPAPDISDQRMILHVKSPDQDIEAEKVWSRKLSDEVRRIMEQNYEELQKK